MYCKLFFGSRGIVFCSGVGYISIRLGAQATYPFDWVV